MGKGLGKTQIKLLHEMAVLEEKSTHPFGVHQYPLKKAIRRLGGVSVAHARERLIRAGYIVKTWDGYVPEKPRNMTADERLELFIERMEDTGPPAYYYSLTDKARAWLKAHKRG